jgi:hypothetical protein
LLGTPRVISRSTLPFELFKAVDPRLKRIPLGAHLAELRLYRFNIRSICDG